MALKLNEAAGFLDENKAPFREYIKTVRPQYIFYKHCEEMIEALQAVADGELDRLMFFMPPRSGKKLADSTPVFTPSGWRAHGELRLGDQVYHPSGRPVTVLAVSEKTPVYHEIEFSDGSVIKCHEQHEWTVYDDVHKQWSTVETDYFIQKTGLGKTREMMSGGKMFYRMPMHGASKTCVGIVDVRRTEQEELGQCIQVSSPDGLYLAGEKLTATHNSELVSRLFPGYFLYKHPEEFVGLASYGADLAYSLSRNARDNYTRWGGKLSGNAAAVQLWETTEGGGLWAAGVGGPATGKGFSLGIIDDPLKDGAEAQSETILDKQWDWYQSTWYTRLNPLGAALIHLQTRWSQDDLAGKLLQHEAVGEDTENWYIINFEAIKSEKSTSFPASCTVLDDHREAGEALCPERQTAEKLKSIKTKVGSYWFSAMYQQSPTAKEGNMWKRDWFKVYDDLPIDSDGNLDVHSGGYDWDTAYTKDERNAANAYVKSFKDDRGGVYIDDFDFQWCETPELVAWMKALKGPHYIEKKATGKSAKQYLDREGIYAIEVGVTGDKIARTRGVLPVAEAGKLYVRRSILARLLDDDKQGLLAFPNGKWKDVNDTVVQAINRHVGSVTTGVSGQWDY